MLAIINGITLLKMTVNGTSGCNPDTAYTVMPIGGVINANSTTITINTPNQRRSKPRDCTVERI